MGIRIPHCPLGAVSLNGKISNLCLVRLTVRPLDSQSRNKSSILLLGTIDLPAPLSYWKEYDKRTLGAPYKSMVIRAVTYRHGRLAGSHEYAIWLNTRWARPKTNPSPLCPNGGMVDTSDLKSDVRKNVPVRVRLWAPISKMLYGTIRCLFL